MATYSETISAACFPILEIDQPAAYWIAARDIYYGRVGNGIENPELDNITSTFSLGISAYDYRIWFRNTAGNTKYLDFTLDNVLTDVPTSAGITLDITNSEIGYTGFILLRKNVAGDSWLTIKDLTLQIHVESIYEGDNTAYQVVDDGTDNYSIWDEPFPTENDTARTDWDMLWFIPGRCLQSVELNDVQLLWKYYQKELGRTLFADGDIVEGCTLKIDQDTGCVTITDGKMYLDGRVRNISGISTYEETEYESVCTTSVSASGATSAFPGISATTTYCYQKPILVKTSSLIVPSAAENHKIGIKVVKWVDSDDDDNCLTDPASGHLNYGNRGAFAARIDVEWYLDDLDAKTIFELYGRDLSRTINDYGMKMSRFYKMLSVRTREESGDYAIENNGFDVQEYNTNSAEISAVGYDGDDLVNSYFDHSRIPYFSFELNKNFIAMVNGNRVAYPVPPDILVRRGFDVTSIVDEEQTYLTGTFLYQVDITTPITDLTNISGTFSRTENTIKGVANGTDSIPNSAGILNVTNIQWFDGVDLWVYTSPADYLYVSGGGTVDWSPGGIEPTTGQTYQITFSYANTFEIGSRYWRKKNLEEITKTSNPYDLMADRDIIKINGIWPLSEYLGNEGLIGESYYTEDTNFHHDNGQRDNVIQNGRIYWDDFGDLEVLSAGEKYYISYEYWHHEVEGDFVSVDSYSHRDYIVNHETYTNANCLDLRTDVATFPVSGSIMYFDYDAYNWRRDVIGINKNTFDIVVIEGDSKLYHNQLRSVVYEKQDTFPICELIIPPYTDDISEILIKNRVVNTQKMEDIHKMSRRISYTEDYMMLNMMEKETLEREVDGTKKGIFIDPFTSITKCDWNYQVTSENPDVKPDWTLDPQQNRCLLPNTILPIALIIDPENSTCDFTNKDAAILNGTEFLLQEQKKASNVISLQPFVTPISAETVPIKLYPQADNWIATEKTESNSVTFEIPVDAGKKLGNVWQTWKTGQEGLPENTVRRSTQYKASEAELTKKYVPQFSRLETEITIAENIPIKAELGNKIKDLSIVTKMRRIPIRLSAEGLIPERDYKCQFNGTDLAIYDYNASYVTDLGLPVNNDTQSYIDAEQMYIDQISSEFLFGTVDSDTNTFQCDDNGKTALTFVLPNENTGFHEVKIVDVVTGEDISKTSFYASGYAQEKSSESMTIGIPAFSIGGSEYVQVRDFPKPDPKIVLWTHNVGERVIYFEEGKWLKSKWARIKIKANSSNNANLAGLLGMDLKIVGHFRENEVNVHSEGVVFQKTITPVMVNNGSIVARVTVKARGGTATKTIKIKIRESFVKRKRRAAIAKKASAAAAARAAEKARIAAIEAARLEAIKEEELSREAFDKLARTRGGLRKLRKLYKGRRRRRLLRKLLKYARHRNRKRYDPVAQSFMIKDKYPEGAFINAVGVYFSTKPNDYVRVAIGKLDDAGFPNRELIFAERVLEPDEINISDSAETETKFIFDTPVYLNPKDEYFFEVFCIDPGINIWYARIGETNILTGKIIMHQANSGTMFVSPNRTTWKTKGKDDLKFKLYGLEFDEAVTEELIFTHSTSASHGAFDVDIDSTQPYNTNIFAYYSTDSQVTWNSIKLNEVKELENEFSSFTLKLQMNTTNKFLSPIIRHSSSALRFISFEPKGRYISKTIEMTESFDTIKLVYQDMENSKTSVVPYVSIDSGVTWEEIISSKNPYELEIPNNYEMEFEKEYTGQELNSCKIKLEMASSSKALTPQIRKLRSLLFVK